MQPELEIDPDIRRARTLPSRFYTDERYFESSRERIFARSWQMLCRRGDVRTLLPVTLLPYFLDEPLLLSRIGDDIVCLSNVCTHRGKVLVEEPCDARLIRCGYHGRRFGLDGKFLSMPEFDGVEDFPSPADDLRRVASDVAGEFVFASLDPAATFEEFLDRNVAVWFAERTRGLKFAGSREYDVDAHWALYCENYLEGFHIPYVHRSLNEVVDYGTYTTETFRYSSLQTGYDDRGEEAGRYLFVFPNLMFNFYPWGLSVNVVRPVTPRRTKVEFLTYVADESKLGKGAGADLHGVELEDEAVVESVQRGIRSRFSDRGRYSPTREQGTHHFHRLIAECMG
ncbi:MAG: aromatic ring-hydroxylating oxygenase subunit alpha [Pyrinomonadaceae bacterium]